MIKQKHYFHNNTNQNGNGVDLILANTSTNTIININAFGTGTCGLSFYGQPFLSEEFIPVNAIKASDYTITKTGTMNETYQIDGSAYKAIRVATNAVSGGEVSVVGMVIE